MIRVIFNRKHKTLRATLTTKATLKVGLLLKFARLLRRFPRTTYIRRFPVSKIGKNWSKLVLCQEFGESDNNSMLRSVCVYVSFFYCIFLVWGREYGADRTFFVDPHACCVREAKL